MPGGLHARLCYAFIVNSVLAVRASSDFIVYFSDSTSSLYTMTLCQQKSIYRRSASAAKLKFHGTDTDTDIDTDIRDVPVV